ncbi:MAG: diacylglycerol kinase family lipid kinase [Calditrichaeota bacterium]|nr:diacylglycerol kinase family lipid kinase [Calditrichota bacterium]
MKYLFIINPKSGKQIHRSIDRLINFRFSGHDYQICKTEEFSEIKTNCLAAVEAKLDCVVAIGGDGTISEVARYLHGSQTALGIIPAGSGNGYARNLGISLKPETALNQLTDSQRIKADMGTVNGNLFIGVAGVGYDAHVAACFNQHGKRGSWPYFKIALREYSKYKNFFYRIKTDTETIETDAFIIAIAKSTQFGNGAIIAPQAKLNDGFFDLVILKPDSFFRTLWLSRNMFNGTLDTSSYVTYKKVRSLEIEREGNYQYHLDGELFGTDRTMKIELLNGALQVMAPRVKSR